MPSKRGKHFEFKLGTVGLTLFTCGISVLLLSAFVFGVFVGKKIESYPHKIALMPTTITQKIVHQKPAKNDAGKEDEFSFTFYDTLQKKERDPIHLKTTDENPSQAPLQRTPLTHSAASKTARGTSLKEGTSLKKGNYMIQVASFKDKARMEKLRGQLASLGYFAVSDEHVVPQKGTWFRLSIRGFESLEAAQRESTKIERSIRGLKCLVRSGK